MGEAGETVVELRSVGRRYGRRWAVRGVDLTVGAGEMVGIVGPDGAGKTTLLQMCAAILDPSEGACRVLGFDTVKESKTVTSRIGYMSQGFTLYDRLSVEENLSFSARVRGVPDELYAPRRARLLEMAGLAPFVDRPAGRLSGGMRKKLALCTNLIHEPPLLILDEPGLGVDPLSRRQLWSILERFRERRITIVVATSYMDEAERCDRVTLLLEGAVLLADRPEAVRRSAAGRVFELETADPSRTARELTGEPDVFGIQVLSDRVRFQRASPAEGSTAKPASKERTSGDRMPVERLQGAPSAGAREAAPTLEDVFVLHARKGDEASARTASARPPASISGLKAKGLTVEFGDFRAVDGVSLDAAPGTVLALLGPNGAGKTTLIRAFCGLVPIARGSAWIADRPVAPGALELHRYIGYMSQRFSLYRDLTLAENLSFFASAYELRRESAARAIEWARAMTGLEAEETDEPVASLSGATRQRVALACSILHRPSVLFLDEPTSGVDPVSRYRFWRLIRALADAGMVVIVTTHYLDEAVYCDLLGLMHQGRLIALGTLAALRTETGTPQDAPPEAVFVAALRAARLGSA